MEKTAEGKQKDMRNKKTFFIRAAAVFIAACLILSLSGCSSGTLKTKKIPDFPVTVGEVEITKPPQKIISLSPGVTDILRYMRLDYILCGVSDYCAVSGERELPKYGTAQAPSLDEIKADGIQLILTQSELSLYDAENLSQAGIDIVCFAPADSVAELERLYTDIATSMLGELEGRQKGGYYFKRLNGEIGGIQSASGAKVLLMIGADAVATGDTLLGSLLTLAGYQNVADGYKNYTMPGEDIANAQIDFLFCAEEFSKEIKSQAFFKKLDVVKSKNVACISIEPFERQGQGLVDGMKQMDSCF